MIKTYISKTAEETEKLGADLAKLIMSSGSPTFVALRGDLGAGKTVFVRGFASVMSPESRVKSPTYTIVNEYLNGKMPLFHFDLYRTGGGDELESFGFEEYFYRGICIVEWSEYLDSLPKDSAVVTIAKSSDTERKITFELPDSTEETV